MKNVIFVPHIGEIGGTESVAYYIAKRYSDRDITVLFVDGCTEQLARLSKYVKLLRFEGQFIECDNLFVFYGFKRLKGHYKCKQGYNCIHANYEFLGEPVIDNNFKNLAVSDWVGKIYEEMSGEPYTLCPNFVEIGKVKKPYLLVSATRISFDKGNLAKRMQMFADELSKRGIPFIWLVFTNSTEKIKNPNVVSMPAKIDILPYIAKADFTVQLSDTEACCMTAVESLTLGTPMIVTKIPSFYEQGLNETNSIFVDFDLSNIDEVVKRMGKKFTFNYEPKPEIWGELLKGKRKEKLNPVEVTKVCATDKWLEGGGIICEDIQRIPRPGEEIVVEISTAEELIERGYAI